MDEKAGKLCGFLNVLKPPGMSSAQVVGVVRRLLDGEKVGHAGTLDPEAAGVLPLMVGKATRLFDELQDHEKAYVAEIAFGYATDTQDAQGLVTERGGQCPDETALRKALAQFTGTIWQTPPMYSAIKRQGKRLYELARTGQTAQVPAREVVVHSLEFRRLTENDGALLSVSCSKGFYVRTLCHDLGQALGCPAYMRFLLRTKSGLFTLDTAQTLETLEEAAGRGMLGNYLLPMDMALCHLPQAEVPEGLETAFRNGGKLPWAQLTPLHGTKAESGGHFCLRLKGQVAAVGVRQGDQAKPRTWLLD